MIAQEREVWTKANKIGTQYVYAVDANDDITGLFREAYRHPTKFAACAARAGVGKLFLSPHNNYIKVHFYYIILIK
jgi:hypothetical protein